MSKRKYTYHIDSNFDSKKSKNLKQSKNNHDDEEDEDGEGGGLGVLKSLFSNKVEGVGNHIWFNDDVTNDSVNKFIKVIHNKNFDFKQKQRQIYCGKLTPSPLYLHIDSFGGDVASAMAAVDCIRNSYIPIYTIIEGSAASAATFMAVAGKKRFITENSVLLIHQLSAGMWGKMSELEDEQKNNKFFMEKIYSIYEKYTTLRKNKLKEILKHDLWWGAKEALDHGFVDAIYTGEVDDVDDIEE